MKGVSVSRIALSAAALALAALAVLAVLQRLGDNERAAGRRALLARVAELDRSALAPGSMLPCVDGTAGETVGDACEKTVFASAQSVAAAVAYMGARIDLLSEAAALAKHGDAGVLAALASSRRALTLDRYGIAAHVLARRDGCTAKQCDAFAMLGDAGALKANLKAQTFDQYVSRYATAWNRPVPGTKPAPAIAEAPVVSAVPAPAATAAIAPAPQPTPLPRPRIAPPAVQIGEAKPMQKPDAKPAEPSVKEARRAPTAAKPELATSEPVKPEPVRPAVSEARAEVPPGGALVVHKPVPSKWHFPSPASIPAISIIAPEPKLPKETAARLESATAHMTAIERRKEGKDAKTPAADAKAKDKQAKNTHTKKKQARKKQEEPGAPLSLTR